MKQKKTIKIKAWIEICGCGSPGCTPTIWNKKPTKKEIENMKEFGYELYECEIKLGKKL